jgi:hypothetical protein
MAYNFIEQKEAAKKNPRYMLPADINKPVIDFLEKIGCKIGVESIKDMQNKLNYGLVELTSEKVPNAKLSIQVDCGMAEGYKQYEIKKADGWTSTTYKMVKNWNVDKKKLTKGVSNERIA